MTVGNVLTAALQAIPDKVRLGLLLLFAGLVVVIEVLQIFEVGLDFDKVNRALLVVGGYLGFQSAANVFRPEPGEHEAD